MGSKARFAVSFILVLAGTLILVAALSAMTQDSPQAAADRYMEQLHSTQQAQELSAPATGQQDVSFLASLGGFLGIILIPNSGWLMMARAKRNSQRAEERRRSRKHRTVSPALKYRV